jgi:hypothetical protein
MLVEHWKYIPSYEGEYMASTFGNIKSVKFGKEKILSPALNRNGYKQVCLHNNRIRKVVRVHQLVAMTFLNHTPCRMEKMVDHIDNNKSNNNLSNLQLVNNRENCSKDRNPESTLTGVYLAQDRFVSRIYFDGKSYHLGFFETKEKAQEKYNEALSKVDVLLKNELLGYLKSCIRENSSKYRGVSYSKRDNKWGANAWVNGKQKWLGSFDSEEDAFSSVKQFKNNNHGFSI